VLCCLRKQEQPKSDVGWTRLLTSIAQSLAGGTPPPPDTRLLGPFVGKGATELRDAKGPREAEGEVRVWVGDRASSGSTLRVDDPPGLVGGDMTPPEVTLSPPPLVMRGAPSDMPADMLRWFVKPTALPIPPPPLMRRSSPGIVLPGSPAAGRGAGAVGTTPEVRSAPLSLAPLLWATGTPPTPINPAPGAPAAAIAEAPAAMPAAVVSAGPLAKALLGVRTGHSIGVLPAAVADTSLPDILGAKTEAT
jgi:hypothetical protein